MVRSQLIDLRCGRSGELESDRFGVQYMSEAGYDPRSMMRVLEILAEAGGGCRAPGFLSTHPDPGNRIGQFQQAIGDLFPNGVPDNLRKKAVA